jgi:alpha-ketoglutarate-dependent taurine dioxygenase
MTGVADLDSATELNARGWVSVKNISSGADLIALSHSIGHPIASPTGELLKEIRVTPTASARFGTLSDAHGLGPFPLHTDTAFWPTPARYIVIRVQGDTRRSTTVRTFEDIFSKSDGDVLALVSQSIWLVHTRSAAASFYCSALRRRSDGLMWRYDASCMSPANRSAQLVAKRLRSISTSDCERITWSSREAVIISNWNALHGRGPAPPNEGERVLQRIYVR